MSVWSRVLVCIVTAVLVLLIGTFSVISILSVYEYFF